MRTYYAGGIRPRDDGHIINIEQSLLGAILIDPEALARVKNVLAPADFAEPAHGRIYATMIEVGESAWREKDGAAIPPDIEEFFTELNKLTHFETTADAHWYGQVKAALSAIRIPARLAKPEYLGVIPYSETLLAEATTTHNALEYARRVRDNAASVLEAA